MHFHRAEATTVGKKFSLMMVEMVGKKLLRLLLLMMEIVRVMVVNAQGRKLMILKLMFRSRETRP
jgi:adenylosuccinate lyase